jgi:hypothetical protein
LLNDAFAMANVDIISRVQFAPFVIMLTN